MVSRKTARMTATAVSTTGTANLLLRKTELDNPTTERSDSIFAALDAASMQLVLLVTVDPAPAGRSYPVRYSDTQAD